MVHDTDGFNRWNAGQSLASQVITSLQSGESDEIDKASAVISKAFKLILNDSLNKKEVDKAMLAHILELPTEGALIEQAQLAVVDDIHIARESVANFLSTDLKADFAEVFNSNFSEGIFSVE